jgi:hypothetical protein
MPSPLRVYSEQSGRQPAHVREVQGLIDLYADHLRALFAYPALMAACAPAANTHRHCPSDFDPPAHVGMRGSAAERSPARYSR